MAKNTGKTRRFFAVDVGGTKILAAVVDESGTILGRQRTSTPREGGAEPVVEEVQRSLEQLAAATQMLPGDAAAMGIAIPGVVNPTTGEVVVTPNMALGGLKLKARMEARYKIPVSIGNDCNLGALGEAWLGSARTAKSSLSMLVGTGIGAGIVRSGKLWRGARESAGEIGHIVMQIGGPKCGCGNHGCFEALASRSAIERDLRQAIAGGESSILTDLVGADLGVIRSSVLRAAVERHDPLATRVIGAAATVIGYACLTVRHLLDPQVIVLGGGVVEALSYFVLPIIQEIVDSDQLPGARAGGQVLLSALGDDAVVVGAAALASTAIGRNPFKKRYQVRPVYPRVVAGRDGQVTIDGKPYASDLFIRVDGKIKKREKVLAREGLPEAQIVGTREIAEVCRGGPAVLFVGTGQANGLTLQADAERFLAQRAIACVKLPTPEAIESYNKSKERRALLARLS